MILQALYEHYYRLLEDPESGVAPPGYSPARVTHAIVINQEGELIDILPLSTQQGKKSVAQILLVPEQEKKTSGITANYLCENAAYLLGIDFDKKDRHYIPSPAKYEKFKHINEDLLRNANGPFALAFISFLKRWKVEKAMEHPVIAANMEGIESSNNIVVKLDGVKGYLHEDSDVRYYWKSDRGKNPKATKRSA